MATTTKLYSQSPLIGEIKLFASSILPAGWLLCDGSAISRTTYKNLFDIIGTNFGTGDGSTTFNLPDFRGRTAIGSGTGTATDATAHSLGDMNGEETHTLTVDELAAHTHNVAGSTSTGSSDTLRLGGTRQGAAFSAAESRGSDFPHNNMQPYTTVNYIIYGGGLKLIIEAIKNFFTNIRSKEVCYGY